MTTVLGVDASFDRLTPQSAAQLRAAGIDVYTQCLWTGETQPEWRVENLRTAQAAGMILCAYAAVTAAGDGTYHAAMALQGLPADLWSALKLCVVDVELPGIPDRTIRDAVEAFYARGKRRCIYTSPGDWTGSQRDSQAFADCLLFVADWDGRMTIDAPTFGGWSLAGVVGKQYANGAEVAGLFADRDIWIQDLLLGGEPMTPQEQAEMATLRTDLGNVFGYAIATHEAIDVVTKAFFDHVVHSGGDTTALAAQIADIQKRLAGAAGALNPPKAAP